MSVTKFTIPRVVIRGRDVLEARCIRTAGAQVGYRRDVETPFLKAHHELKAVNVGIFLSSINK